jgi:hypothetical protein
MSFYPQKKLEKEQKLLLKVFLSCLGAHILLVLALFIKDAYQRSTHLLTLASRPGAEVSFGKSTAHQAARPLPSAPTAAVQSQHVDPTPIKALEKAENPPERPLPQAPKKAPQKKSPPVPKKALHPPPSQKGAQKKALKDSSPILYTELKKEYSTLKRPSKPAPEKPKAQPLVKKEIVPKAEKKGVLSAPTIEPALASVPAPDPVPVAKAAYLAEPAPIAEVSAANPTVASEPAFVPNKQAPSGPIAQTTTQSTMQVPATAVTVDLENPASTDQLTYTICQEIGRYFKRPIGFDDQEALTISFEISRQKAENISSRGSEPLVLYSAIKEALLKSTFSGIVVPIKVTLVYH